MANTPNEAKGFYKLSWMQRIGFGAGDMAQNLIYQTVSIWLLFFYTNVFGLKPGPAALMFLIVRLVPGSSSAAFPSWASPSSASGTACPAHPTPPSSSTPM